MARIEYDEDEQGGKRPPAGDWRRRLVTWTLAVVGLGIGFLVPYTLYLNHQISERFGELRWQVPTRVYARPLRLAPIAPSMSRKPRLEIVQRPSSRA